MYTAEVRKYKMEESSYTTRIDGVYFECACIQCTCYECIEATMCCMPKDHKGWFPVPRVLIRAGGINAGFYVRNNYLRFLQCSQAYVKEADLAGLTSDS